GDNDLQRFLRRHRHTWGIVLGKEYEKARLALELPDDAPLAAAIERGPRHVDPDLVTELQEIQLSSITVGQAGRRTDETLSAASARSRAAVRDRDVVRKAWAIGGPSDGIITEAASVRLKEPGLRTTSYVAATTRSLLWSLATTFLVGAIWVALYALPQAAGSSTAVLLALAFSFAGGLALSAGLAVRAVRRLLVEEPPDLILLDIG